MSSVSCPGTCGWPDRGPDCGRCSTKPCRGCGPALRRSLCNPRRAARQSSWLGVRVPPSVREQPSRPALLLLVRREGERQLRPPDSGIPRTPPFACVAPPGGHIRAQPPKLAFVVVDGLRSCRSRPADAMHRVPVAMVSHRRRDHRVRRGSAARAAAHGGVRAASTCASRCCIEREPTPSDERARTRPAARGMSGLRVSIHAERSFRGIPRLLGIRATVRRGKDHTSTGRVLGAPTADEDQARSLG